MEKITKEVLAELLETDAAGPAATIYSPMHKAASPPLMSENQIRLKNLIHQAAEQLRQQGGGQALADVLCQQLDQWLGDREFWESQTEGLLVCARDGQLRLFQLPMDTEEYVAVDDSFHLAPVLGLVQDAQAFYVLSVAQHAPQLYTGDMYGLYPTDVALPETVESGLNIDEKNQKSEHQRSASWSSLNTSGFHGRGGSKDPGEEDRARFWRMIDNIVCHAADRSLPLILAGIDAETAEYRHLSKYPKILGRTISGSFSGAKPHDLFEPAYTIVREELIEPRHRQAVEEYQQIRGANPERAASDKAAITEAAKAGRIDKLLVRMSRYTADTVRDTAQAVSRISFPEPELSTAINKLALAVWRTSGAVICLSTNLMPDGAPMAARLRY